MGFATVHRTASVKVLNETCKRLVRFRVWQQYSNVFSNYRNFYSFGPGTTTEQALEVDCNTGSFTTGRDWWFVGWQCEGDNFEHYTKPHKVRARRHSRHGQLGQKVPHDDPILQNSTAGKKQLASAS